MLGAPSSRKRRSPDPDPTAAEEQQPQLMAETPELTVEVTIVNIKNASSVRFIWKCESGTEYAFDPGGTQWVIEPDASELLGLQHHGGGCCGVGSTETNYFVREG